MISRKHKVAIISYIFFGLSSIGLAGKEVHNDWDKIINPKPSPLEITLTKKQLPNTILNIEDNKYQLYIENDSLKLKYK